MIQMNIPLDISIVSNNIPVCMYARPGSVILVRRWNEL